MRRSVLTAAVVTTVAAAAVGLSATTATAAAGVPTQTVVHFARGTDSATLTGHVRAHGDVRYAVDARAGQTARFLFTGGAGSSWTLVGPTGPAVHDADSGDQGSFSYELPETGRYYVDVVSPRSTDYSLNLVIPPTRGAATPITFARGGTSASAAGTAAAGEQDRYTFAARAGQHARIRLTGDASTLGSTLVAPDGTPLHTTHTEQQGDVTVTLPGSGTYRLTVTSAVRTAYQLTLDVPRG